MNDRMSFGHAAATDQIDDFPVVYSTDVVSEASTYTVGYYESPSVLIMMGSSCSLEALPLGARTWLIRRWLAFQTVGTRG
jgi:hypothetical protein